MGRRRWRGTKYWLQVLTEIKIRPPGLGRDLSAPQAHQAATVDEAEKRVPKFKEEWGTKHPAIVRLWSNSRAEFVPFLQFDREIRRIVCTTKAIEIAKELGYSDLAGFSLAFKRWTGHSPTEFRRR